MDRLVITQHLKTIKIYYKNGNSVTVTYRVLIGDYCLHSRPTTQAIGKIVKKILKTGVVTSIKRSVYHHFVRSAVNIAIVSEGLAEDPNVSIIRRSQELGLSYTALYGVFCI